MESSCKFQIWNKRKGNDISRYYTASCAHFYLTRYNYSHGGLTACQVEHHVRTKFATPILQFIDNFEIMIFFYIYITFDNIF